MSRNDIRVVNEGGSLNAHTRVWQTEAGEADIALGEPVKLKADGSPYVIPMADGDPVIGTDTAIGFTADASDHDATNDGTVEVFEGDAKAVYAVKAKVATNADTQDKIDALVGKTVGVDLTSGEYTIDTTAVNDNTKGFVIVGGDPERKEIHVRLRQAAIDGNTAA